MIKMGAKLDFFKAKQCIVVCCGLLWTLFMGCQKAAPTLFESMPASKTGVAFANMVEENDSINVLDYMNIYTGAGVAAGDVNNDGLVDLFFSGNHSTCRLYLNRGNLKFEDVTEQAGLLTDRWCTGASMADINQDGLLDIYVCVSGNPKQGNTSNLLFINQGGLKFSEKAAEYGLDDKRLIMNASFLDYDLDGDLDLFLITNPADQLVSNINNVIEQKLNGEGKGTDILYRNEGNGHFTDVSKAAGITKDGYSLGAAVADFNQDGFPDIYVSNDFISSDILYVNNGDGTFTDSINTWLKHSSFASMGNDAADINNDGLTDIFVLDMLPEDNYRRKMLIPPVNIDKFDMAQGKGYLPQYTRNTLQLNLGNPPAQSIHRETNTPPETRFSDIAMLSGINATDWSWAPLFADFDLDGDKDLLVTNGFYRDLGNLDYINYQFSQRSPMGTEQLKRAKKLSDIKSLESAPLLDYLFENNGDLTFTKRSEAWGFTEKGFSNGACFADLDNDGDLEIVINQFNAPAKIYKNNTRNAAATKQNPAQTRHFISLKLAGNAPNLQGFGAKVSVFTPDGRMQFQEFNPLRGYESSMDPRLYFGLGQNTVIDSIVVIWQDGARQIMKQLLIDQWVTIEKNTNNGKSFTQKQPTAAAQLFEPYALQTLDFEHVENNFIDFKNLVLLTQQYSKNSPAIAVADVNGDGLDDFYISGAKDGHGVLYTQQKDGRFTAQTLSANSLADLTAVCFFDANGDKHPDLYIAKGGSEYPEGADALQDELWINDGYGHFALQINALPDTKNAASCAVSCDFDHDGDLDIFVGGRVKTGDYPNAPRSMLLKNEGGTLLDVTPDFLRKIGMVADAVWADVDQNGFEDLVLVGEFMPLTILKNDKGVLQMPVSNPQQKSSAGWWNSVAAADFDHDGDLDLVAGNLGLNSRYKAAEHAPLSVFASDFDKNGRIDPIFCYYEQGNRYIFPTRDELTSQIPAMKKRFPDYQSFAKNTFDKSFRSDELKSAFALDAFCFESSYFENTGGGNFNRHTLPMPAQFSPLQDFLIEDFNQDGQLDLLTAGNFYGAEYTTGRYDAGVGCLFLGDGKGGFIFVENRKSGFWADGDVRDLAKIRLQNGKTAILIGNNNSKMQLFLWNQY